MALTTEKLIEILKKQPKGTKILLEDSNGGSSNILERRDVIDAWERDEYDHVKGKSVGTEHVMMLSKYKG